MKAFCYRTGVIEMGRSVPKGARLIASGPAKKIRFHIGAMARHGFLGRLLVPGIPEAGSEEEEFSALLCFRAWADFCLSDDDALRPVLRKNAETLAAKHRRKYGMGGAFAKRSARKQPAA